MTFKEYVRDKIGARNYVDHFPAHYSEIEVVQFVNQWVTQLKINEVVDTVTNHVTLCANWTKLKERSEAISLLEKYSLFLEKQGYLDTDWRTEEPFAIDEFLKQK